LFEETLRGLREEAAADPRAAAAVDLDVIDLTVLVEAWAVLADRAGTDGGA
jgi:hypothetical protein